MSDAVRVNTRCDGRGCTAEGCYLRFGKRRSWGRRPAMAWLCLDCVEAAEGRDQRRARHRVASARTRHRVAGALGWLVYAAGFVMAIHGFLSLVTTGPTPNPVRILALTLEALAGVVLVATGWIRLHDDELSGHAR